MKSGFLNRLLSRAEKIDKEQMVDYMIEIAGERDLLILLFNSMIEGMTVIDDEEKVVYINRSAREILRLGDGSTTPGLPFVRVMSRPDLISLCREGIESEDPILSREWTFQLPEGRRFLQVNMIPLINKGERSGTLILFIDETEHKEKEEKLREAEKLAALTTMSAGMSHEIRNPLNSLSIHLQLLQRHLKNKSMQDKEVDDILGIFTSEIKRLNDVIESFLSSVRPTQPAKRITSLYNLVTQTLTLMEPDFRENGIRVSLLEEGDWPYVEVDPAQMQQVFINILRNAIEAITSQSREERADKDKEVLLRMGRDEEKVTLVFTDTGKGIEPEALPHIFEPYFTQKPKGTGLGLMIADRIVREHEGTISARSVPGEGTQLVLSLPIAADNLRLLEHGKEPDVHKTEDKSV